MFDKKTIDVNGTKIVVPNKFTLFKGMDKYPVLCVILEKRGDSHIVDFDWGGFFKDEKNHYYKLKKRGHTFMPPQYSQLLVTIEGKDVLFLDSPARGEYVAINPQLSPTQEENLKANADLRIWMVNEVKRILLRSTNFWEKNFPVILLFMMIVVALLGIWIVYDALGGIVGSFAGAVGNLGEAVRNLSTTIGSSGKPTPVF